MKEPLLIFDIGNEYRYKKEHIPGSWFIDKKHKNMIRNLFVKLPRDIDTIFVEDGDNANGSHLKELIVADILENNIEVRIRYLQGGLAAWQWGKTTQTDPKITSKQLKAAIDHGKINKEILLLDVREPNEYSSWNIEGSKNIPLCQIPNLLDQIPRDKNNKKVITICPAGNRSGIATLLLHQLGYHNVKTLEGGLRTWSSTNEHVMQKFVVKGGKKVRLIQIRRIGKGCLSYILEANYEAAVIDPVFPIDDYIKIAEGDAIKAKINKVFDTHLHADHISAARKLTKKTNAQLYLSPYEEGYDTKLRYNASKLDDVDTLMIGSVPVKVIYSPGHTVGGISLLVGDKLLFTGDTLFIDNIGRPDLFEDKRRKGVVVEEYVNMLHDTLHQELFKIPDETFVFPAHHDKLIKADTLLTSNLASIKKIRRLQEIFGLTKPEFTKRMVSSITEVTTAAPPNYKEIRSINEGKKPVPSPESEIYELEMGPNRCSTF